MKKIVKKKLNKLGISLFRPIILTRHPTQKPLRTQLQKLPFRSVVRFGSTTPMEKGRVELNSVEAVKNSSSKLRMKNCFKADAVKTADWIHPVTGAEVRKFFNTHQESGIVCKSIFGSRGKGNTLVRNTKELEAWMNSHGNSINNYIIEKFYNYSREYRLHVNKNGCFYTCRKMLKSDVPEEKRWYRNNDNSVWIMENNPSFDKPVNWKKVEAECVKACRSVGLDFGAVDLRIQSAKAGKDPDFIVVEINSAPSFGEVTLQKYLEVIPQLLKEKHNG